VKDRYLCHKRIIFTAAIQVVDRGGKVSMDTDLLRSFVAVVDTGSFTRAAKQIFRTQSAISMQIKRLEEQCGRVLFIRNGRSLELTEEGRSLLGYARQILQLHDEALTGLRQRRSYKPLRLGCPEDYSRQLLPDLIIMLRQRFPGLQLEVSASPTPVLRQLLDSGELVKPFDIGMTPGIQFNLFYDKESPRRQRIAAFTNWLHSEIAE